MSAETLTLASSVINAQLVGASRETKLFVSDLLSYEVEGANQSVAFKSGNWNGRSSFFDFRTGVFPAGFTHMVAKELRKRGHPLHLAVKEAPSPLGPEVGSEDPMGLGFEERYEYQPETVRRLLRHKRMIARCATGCHAKGQKVLMFDGSLKAVEDVVVGDQLMGPDSFPRNVLALHRGRDQMYRVSPLRGGRPFVVNAGHILSLQQTNLPTSVKACAFNGRWINISVSDYLTKDQTFKHIHKLHKSKGIEFPKIADPILSPYLLGLLLGDGHIKGKAPSITSADSEIEDYCNQWASHNGMAVSVDLANGSKAFRFINCWHGGKRGGRRPPNRLFVMLRSLGVAGLGSADKHVPIEYKVGSRETRLAILAGLIDTDGYNHNGGFDYVTKSERLAQDVAFIARSLGLRVHENVKVIGTGRYAGYSFYRLSISGDCSIVPCKIARKQQDPRMMDKCPTMTGFTIDELTEDDYYGFEVDDDHLYLLDDFTITHNSGKSRIAVLAYNSIRRMTLFLTTHGPLMYQMKKNFEQAGFKPGMIGDSILQPRQGVNVAMTQTIASWLQQPLEADRSEAADKQRERRRRMIELLHKFEFVIGEEAHEAGGNSYYEILSHCVNAHYRLALTATPFMRADEEANMRLQASFGSIGIDVSEKLLIDRGILARPFFKFLPTPQPNLLRRSTRWPTCYDIGVVENAGRNHLAVTEAVRAAKHGRSALMLIQRQKHGFVLEKMLKDAGVQTTFIFGDKNQAEREEALRDLKSHRLDVLVGSTILDVGVDVPAIGSLILAGGYKAEVQHRQRIGRGLREKKTGANNCFVTDFSDECNRTLRDHAATRLAIVANTPGFAEGVLSPGQEFAY